MPTKKLIIGLTGGLASGKTKVSDYFGSLGVSILDADVIVRQLHQDPTIQHSIRQQFGSIDRPALKVLIFNDPQAKQWLEQLFHPRVLQWISEWTLPTNSPYGLLVAPLLIEAGLHKTVDRVLVVDCDLSLQRQRAAERDQISEDLAARIITQQAKREQRLLFADDVILNHGSIAELEVQVKLLHERYLQLAQQA